MTKCPQCESEGLTSTLTYLNGGYATTDIAWTPYHDLRGHYHNHNPNICADQYICSNHHEFKVYPQCPAETCNWYEETEKLSEEWRAKRLKVKY